MVAAIVSPGIAALGPPTETIQAGSGSVGFSAVMSCIVLALSSRTSDMWCALGPVLISRKTVTPAGIVSGPV